MIKRWPLHPKPDTYQLLYKWIERLAEAYGINYQKFCKDVLELTSQEIDNLSICLPQRALSILSEGTGVPIADLHERDSCTMFKKLQQDIAEGIKQNPDEWCVFEIERSINYHIVFID